MLRLEIIYLLIPEQCFFEKIYRGIAQRRIPFLIELVLL